jgi:cell shape-determining protein MreC
MRKTVAYPFFALCFSLFCWINLPKSVSERLRYGAAWSFGHFADTSIDSSQEGERLQLENQALRAQIEQVRQWLLSDQHLHEQWEIYKTLTREQKAAPLLQRRAEQMSRLLLAQLVAVPARVVYRDPSSWSSSLWVNVGEEENRSLGQEIIAKNSPVVSEGALVGVVDYVGKKQARIRLITDSGLSPSVRAVRGAGSEESYLAKGEVHGSSAPFWRSRGPILQGLGFNYDYPDEESGAKELKGQILKEGDLLVTSGLDGVFPPGLKVGTVSRVAPLKEGGYAYDLEARPAARHLNELQTVFILPALTE